MNVTKKGRRRRSRRRRKRRRRRRRRIITWKVAGGSGARRGPTIRARQECPTSRLKRTTSDIHVLCRGSREAH
eukprot:492265-Pyramimonas_sp.AAC.2